MAIAMPYAMRSNPTTQINISQKYNNMIIDFSNIQPTIIDRFKGGEKHFEARMHCDDSARIMQARLVPGASIGLHTHEGNCEIIFITKGQGTLIDDGQTMPIAAGQCAYCPEGHSHSLINSSNEPLEFYAAVPAVVCASKCEKEN